MKFTNISKLLINFKGGGLINFPFKHLKEVDIDGDSDEQSGGEGGGSAELTKLDTIKNYVNILYDHYNVEFDVVEETSTHEEEVEDENEDPTDEVITVTTKTYKFVPKIDIPKVYLIGDDEGAYTQTRNDRLILNSTHSHGSEPYTNAISKIVLNDTELTTQQLINYDIIQVGVAKFSINTPNNIFDDYTGYLEYLDWLRNNVIEDIEVPILLIGEPISGNTRSYRYYGFIESRLFISNDKGYYTQTINGVIEQE